MALIKCHVTSFIQLFGLTLKNKAANIGIQWGRFIENHGPLGGRNEGVGVSLKGIEGGIPQIQVCKKDDYPGGFQMPLHYPRYNKVYESMEDWRLDMLLKDYGLSFKGALHEKRAFAMGTFLWPHQMSITEDIIKRVRI